MHGYTDDALMLPAVPRKSERSAEERYEARR